MPENGAVISEEEAVAWARECLDDAVQTVAKTGIFEGITFESKVAWALPNKIMIGRIRDSGPSHREFWIIAGDLPTDCIDASTCATPRDAARHFALKWQLGADQIRDPNTRAQRGLVQDMDWEIAGQELESVASALYAVVDEDDAWSSGK